MIDGWRPHQRRDEYPLGHRFHSATLRPGVADFLLLADPFQLPFAKHSGSARRFHDVPRCGVSPSAKPKGCPKLIFQIDRCGRENYGAIGRRVCKSLRIARLAAAEELQRLGQNLTEVQQGDVEDTYVLAAIDVSII
jgi:hypothetical protein